MNPRPVASFLGRLLLFLSLGMLLPAVVSLAYGETSVVLAFVGSAAATALGGLTLHLLGGKGETYRREGTLIVAGGWILASLFGALPYLLTATLPMPVDALFESASGFTTTGSTVLTDIEAASRGVLFWRSFTQWLGGMGIIVLFVALMPELGPGARYLYKLEVPGPTAESLVPRIKDTAAVLWRIYLMLTVAETALLMLVGLDLYDALTHTFSTLSTGGFSPRADSIGAFPPVVHVIVIVFMILAGGNFSLYYGLRQRRHWNLLRDYEFRFYLILIGAVSVLITADLLINGGYELSGKVVLDALFQVASIVTTTGFGTSDFEPWPSLSRFVLVALMFFGGCAGSTSGSMKIMRMLIGLRSAAREVRLTFSPSSVISIVISGKPVPEAVVKSVSGFFILFITSWGIGTLILTATGHDLITAATASITTLGNVGPGLGAIGPTDNFAFFGAGHKLLMVLLMWLGRLELYAIAGLFTLSFWRR